MKKKRYFKGGIHNPLILRNAKFDYEVVEDGEVKTVEYEDCGEVYSYPEKTIVISSLSGGSDLGKNKFIVDLSTSDALKTLRKGEIISLKLSFSCNKDKDGKLVQHVSGENLFTLDDYYRIREAESFHKGQLAKGDKK